jgi:hypothetical protein
MTDRLAVDTAILRETGAALRTCHQEFSHAAESARPDRSIIAHPGLRDRLEDFADNWDDRRTEMINAIEGLSDAASGAADVYENVEEELVKALEGR